VNQSTNNDSPDSTAKNIAQHLIANLSRGGEPIEFQPIHAFELIVLVTGGVTAKDFEQAAQIWVETTRKINGPDWGFIKSVALRRAAEREMLVREASNG
jgi:hypothetical protein